MGSVVLMLVNLKPDSAFSRKCIGRLSLKAKDRTLALVMDCLDILSSYTVRKMPKAPQSVLDFTAYRKTDDWAKSPTDAKAKAWRKFRKNEEFIRWNDAQRKVQVTNYSNAIWLEHCIETVKDRFKEAGFEFYKVYKEYPKKILTWTQKEY